MTKCLRKNHLKKERILDHSFRGFSPQSVVCTTFRAVGKQKERSSHIAAKKQRERGSDKDIYILKHMPLAGHQGSRLESYLRG
jgi:hypothetical protein